MFQDSMVADKPIDTGDLEAGENYLNEAEYIIPKDSIEHMKELFKSSSKNDLVHWGVVLVNIGNNEDLCRCFKEFK